MRVAQESNDRVNGLGRAGVGERSHHNILEGRVVVATVLTFADRLDFPEQRPDRTFVFDCAQGVYRPAPHIAVRVFELLQQHGGCASVADLAKGPDDVPPQAAALARGEHLHEPGHRDGVASMAQPASRAPLHVIWRSCKRMHQGGHCFLSADPAERLRGRAPDAGVLVAECENQGWNGLR